jgi:tRNA 2-thiouridine synthesizing protein B
MLFTVNKSPFTSNSLQGCLRFVQKGSPVLLFEDGVFGAAKGTSLEPMVKAALENLEIYALQEDLNARGITSVIDGVKFVDYSGFVDLVEKHNICPWI